MYMLKPTTPQPTSLKVSRVVHLTSDFASSLFGWTIYRGIKLSYVGGAVLALIAIALMLINRRIIIRSEKEAKQAAK